MLCPSICLCRVIIDMVGSSYELSTTVNVLTAFSGADCPGNITGVVSPHTGLATFDLTTGSATHRLNLPVGKYRYQILQDGRSCDLTVSVKGEFSQAIIFYPNLVFLRFPFFYSYFVSFFLPPMENIQ